MATRDLLYECNEYLIPFPGTKCQKLSAPMNGSMTSSLNFTFKDVVQYKCDWGFEMKGDRQRTCQADGRWTGIEPYCESKYLTFLVLHHKNVR